MEKYVNKTEVAAFFGVSRFAIDKWVSQRCIPHLRVGRCVRFSIPEVLAHFQAEQANGYLATPGHAQNGEALGDAKASGDQQHG